MATFQQFRLPDLGEGLTEGEILSWLVKVGDTVRLNQPIVEVETAKAAVEVPSPFAGLVTELHHEEGETVPVGSPIITIDTDPDAAAAPAPTAPTAPAEPAEPTVEEEAVEREAVVRTPPAEGRVEPGVVGGGVPTGPPEPALPTDPAGPAGPAGPAEPLPPAAPQRTAVLVGYGVKSTTATRRPRRAVATARPDEPAPVPPARVSAEQVGAAAARAAGAVTVLAKPPVRKRAKELGVDLRAITGTGPHGTISRSDVDDAAALAAAGPTAAAAPAAPAQPSLAPVAASPGFDPATREQRIPVRGVQRAMAAAMVASAFTAPHVSEFVQADVTASVDLLARMGASRDYAGVRLSPLTLAARALCVAVRRHPMVNSTWDDAAGEIVVKESVNLGIAAATPRGLVVPNVKDAARLPLLDLARALNDLADTARAGKTAVADLQGGTITITNVGVFGVDSGTPILNPGEAAILCLGAVRPMPWVHQGAIAIRQVTTLGLSFDHRIVDGALGSQVLADVAAMLTDPTLLVAWG